MERYGIKPRQQQMRPQPARHEEDFGDQDYGYEGQSYGYEDYYPAVEEPIVKEPKAKPPLPYVPEEEIDRSIDYGEYTFNSEDFEDYRKKVENDDLVASKAQAQPQKQEQLRPQQAANTVAFTLEPLAELLIAESFAHV